MVSMKTIAERCGVSTATVSKALNDHRDISEATKKRIRAVADELGYFPNAAARALKTNRSYSIGVLFEEEAGSGLTHEYFSGVLNGFKFEAEKLGYDITFINTNFDASKMSYLEHCRYRNFDGVAIVCADDFQSQDVVDLMNSDLPVVTIDYVHHNCTAVCSNNVQGMESLVKYIYSKGHRKIAYIHGQNNTVTRDRLSSFYRTAEELGLSIPDEYIKAGVYLETKGAAKATKELLSLKDRPTCIIYPDDTSMIGGRNVLMEAGLSIPQDMSIAGYDGTKISQLLHPKLTTIQQSKELIGSEAATRLIRAIEQPKTSIVERVVIEGTLIEGQSVAEIEVK